MTPTITAGLVVSILALAGGGIGAYNNVTNDIRENGTRLQESAEQNTERYNGIKEDTKEIRDLLNKLLLQQAERDG